MASERSPLLTRELGKRIFHPNAFQSPEPPYPWIQMPSDGEPFDEPGSIAMPAADGSDNVVVSYTCRDGYEGILTGKTFLYSGNAATYIDGDPSLLLWRIFLNEFPIPSHGVIPFQQGALERPRPLLGGFRFTERDVLRLYINVPVGSTVDVGAGNFAIGLLSGWVWPLEYRR